MFAAAIPDVRDSAQGSEPAVMAAASESSSHRATISPAAGRFRQFHLTVDGVDLGLTPSPMNRVHQHFRGCGGIRIEFFCDGDDVPFTVIDACGNLLS